MPKQIIQMPHKKFTCHYLIGYNATPYKYMFSHYQLKFMFNDQSTGNIRIPRITYREKKIVCIQKKQCIFVYLGKFLKVKANLPFIKLSHLEAGAMIHVGLTGMT